MFLKLSQNNKSQKIFYLHCLLNPFLQLAADKKDLRNGVALHTCTFSKQSPHNTTSHIQMLWHNSQFHSFYKDGNRDSKIGLNSKKRLTLCRMKATAHWVEKDLSFCYSRWPQGFQIDQSCLCTSFIEGESQNLRLGFIENEGQQPAEGRFLSKWVYKF